MFSRSTEGHTESRWCVGGGVGVSEWSTSVAVVLRSLTAKRGKVVSRALQVWPRLPLQTHLTAAFPSGQVVLTMVSHKDFLQVPELPPPGPGPVGHITTDTGVHITTYISDANLITFSSLT